MSVKPITGWKFFYWIAGFFLIIFAANGLLAYLAISSNSGLETEDAYEKGIAYNKDIARAKGQADKKLSVYIAADAQPDKLVRLSVRVRDAADAPYMNKDVTVLFFRPAKQGNDKVITLKEKKPGIYRGATVLPLKGIWDLKLTIKDAGQIVYKTKSRVVLR